MDVDVKDRIRRFIVEEVLYDEGRQVANDQELLGDVLDSLALLQLVDYVERQFGIEVEDDDMVPENFRSLDALERYVRARAS